MATRLASVFRGRECERAQSHRLSAAAVESFGKQFLNQDEKGLQ